MSWVFDWFQQIREIPTWNVIVHCVTRGRSVCFYGEGNVFRTSRSRARRRRARRRRVSTWFFETRFFENGFLKNLNECVSWDGRAAIIFYRWAIEVPFFNLYHKSIYMYSVSKCTFLGPFQTCEVKFRLFFERAFFQWESETARIWGTESCFEFN